MEYNTEFIAENYRVLDSKFSEYMSAIVWERERELELLIHFLSIYSKTVWDSTCSSRVLNIIIDSLNNFINKFESISEDLTAELEQLGYGTAMAFLKLQGFTDVQVGYAKDPLRPILKGSWSKVIQSYIAGIENIVSGMPNGTKWLLACSTVIDELREVFLQNEWRATRIIRTELSHAYHSGILECSLRAPGALKALVTRDGAVLDIKQPLEQFKYNDEAFWAPPGHPNSRNSMILIK